MKPKAIIFDLDGTIIDSIDDLGDSMNAMLANNGYPTHSIENYITWVGNGARLLLQRALPDVKDEALQQKYLKEFLAVYATNYNVKTKIYEGVAEFLDFLVRQNIQITILTNKPHAETQKIANDYLTPWPFEMILGQREAFPKKPDPQVALKMASDLNLRPSEMLFIGDSATDIKTAVAAGMKPIGVNWGYGTKESMLEAGASIIIESPKELFDIVKN